MLLKYIVSAAFIYSLLSSCVYQEPATDIHVQFNTVKSDHSGLHFSNKIIENDTLNYYTFPYLYMGGGVAIGDINNDGLADIFLTGNLKENKLFLNKGNLQFEDITQAAGVEGDQRWYTGVTMADVNHDGWLDIYLCVSGIHPPFENQLLINNQNNTFSEQAESYGIADASTSIQSSFFDYDLDGDLDLYVANYPQLPVTMGNQYYALKMAQNDPHESGHLFQNQGSGVFVDVSAKAGVQNFGLSLGVMTTDFNQDGYPDIYVSNDFNVPDYYYQNNGDGTFSELLKSATRHTSMFGMGVDAADINNDGLMDLGQVDMTPEDYKRAKTNMASMRPAIFQEAVDLGFHYQYMQNSIQLNRGMNDQNIPIFSEISRYTNMATTDWSWGIQFIDMDNDGLKDVFISNGMLRDVNNNDVLAKYENEKVWGAVTTDYKHLPSVPIKNYAFKNQDDLDFSNETEAWGFDYEGFSNGFSHADLDNDGDLDLVLNNLNDEVLLMENQASLGSHHYIQIKLKGPELNPFGIGASVHVHDGRYTQLETLSLTRGFQSSVSPIIHFGTGESDVISQIKVTWPDGKIQVLRDQDVDQLIELSYRDATIPQLSKSTSTRGFKDIAAESKITYVHQEDDYNDFAREPLLPHKNSEMGPSVSVADVNLDGLEDFFIGSAAGHVSALYIQQSDGSFAVQDGPWSAHQDREDTGAHFYDADSDGDQDLYVVSGGNDPQRADQHYQDRLYMNTSQGFIYVPSGLPTDFTSGQVVTSADYDKDGDLDLFVGGRLVPGQYPKPASSHLLRNEGGRDSAIIYTDVTKDLAPALMHLGLVTSAVWVDFDVDGQLDLIIAGEWMPITFLRQHAGAFQIANEKLQGIDDTEGWWYSLAIVDADADGDMDIIAGNLGLNYKYKASIASPFEVYAHDFDENERLDIVLSYSKKGVQLPVRGRECSAEQVPALAQRFKTFQSFAEADLVQLYGKNMLQDALKLEAKTFAHYMFENKGDLSYERHLLPAEAQLSSINAIEVTDYNSDQYPDLMIWGNLFGSEVETPRNDAGVGLILTGAEDNQYKVVSSRDSGLYVPYDVKSAAQIVVGPANQTSILLGINNDRLQLLSQVN